MRSNDNTTGSHPARLHARTLGLALLLTGALGIPACADNKPSATSPCPCATGNTCCSSGVCAKDEASCGDATLALAQEAAGTWTGYFENFTLASGSDALKISIAVSGQTTSGEVTVGTASPPPPPQKGQSTPWPPGSFDAGTGGTTDMVEGFVYQARNIRWESRRLKFNVALTDAWQAVCDLYTPITVGNRTFICPAEGFGWGFVPGEMTYCFIADGLGLEWPCDDAYREQCNPTGRCACGETSCTANAGELNIDVALRGNEGDGSANGVVDTNIRLIRSSH